MYMPTLNDDILLCMRTAAAHDVIPHFTLLDHVELLLGRQGKFEKLPFPAKLNVIYFYKMATHQMKSPDS
jgi:hypothetical protein